MIEQSAAIAQRRAYNFTLMKHLGTYQTGAFTGLLVSASVIGFTLRYLIEHIGQTWWYVAAVAIAAGLAVALFCWLKSLDVIKELRVVTLDPASLALRLEALHVSRYAFLPILGIMTAPTIILQWPEWSPVIWVASSVAILSAVLLVVMLNRVFRLTNRYYAQADPNELLLEYKQLHKYRMDRPWLPIAFTIIFSLNMVMNIFTIFITTYSSYQSPLFLQWSRYANIIIWPGLIALYWSNYFRFRKMGRRLQASGLKV